MKKIILLIIIQICFISYAKSQTRLKWNAAYWLAGVTNMSAETRLGEHFTFNMDVVYSPWKSLKNNSFEFLQFIPEVRYYPNESFRGFYVGGYFAWHFMFRLTKWNYINQDYFCRGNGLSTGIVIGYQIAMSERWNLDVYAGGGFQDSGYRGYRRSTGERIIEWNRSAEWIPYKVGIAFAYRLGRTTN